MFKKPNSRIGLGVAILPLAIALIAPGATQAQIPNRPAPANLAQGRGVAQGASFNRGRNANVTLNLDGENFGLELTEILPSNVRGQSPARVQYRGAITRRTDDPASANSFSLFTRVRSFDSSANLRIITNTTGTCRIEVFDARVISSDCSTIADNSKTEFLGLEQF
ncbi:hypothetical protein VB780_23285 [Leptolyngbya sp. CCNP1308]|uniref:hypothetical protein n=1 Tax=Leptolyngbya sp. CCNP1308 TaxID=3110255 RepID=UPI002B1EB7AD|nr:hypothetical protein [Leptolyngbya sp. CCNP1308]MEA5451521.1 hypothetical protein [Leptolyngbya sp. CCNP1308]